MENISGIYKIEDKQNRQYIGSAKNIRKRICSHFRMLKRNSHHSKKLQNVYNKYGADYLKVSVVEVCEVENLIKIEQHYIDELKPFFNISPTAGSPLGTKRSEETKRRQSEIRIGKPIHNEEFKIALSKRNRNRIWSEESKRKNSESKKGKKYDSSFGEKISKANKGRKLSEEHKKKIGQSNKGRKINEVTARAVAEANSKRVWSEKSRLKQKLASTGRIFSEESRRKRSESMKSYFLNKNKKQNG
jgi:group I intron endonuclease